MQERLAALLEERKKIMEGVSNAQPRVKVIGAEVCAGSSFCMRVSVNNSKHHFCFGLLPDFSSSMTVNKLSCHLAEHISRDA